MVEEGLQVITKGSFPGVALKYKVQILGVLYG
jgi:hypothetical protein